MLELFLESFRLQTSAGDLGSAAIGFNEVLRARRGDPWPRDVRATNSDKGCHTEVEGGPASRVNVDNSSTSTCLNAFLTADEDRVVQEFTSRWAENFEKASDRVRKKMFETYKRPFLPRHIPHVSLGYRHTIKR